MSRFVLSGRVLTPGDEPVPAAAVYFMSGPAALPDIAQVTGADGRFSLSVPVTGRYRIGVNAPGWPTAEQEVEVGADEPVSIDIRLGAGEELDG